MNKKHQDIYSNYKKKQILLQNYIKNLWLDLNDNINDDLLSITFVHKSFSNDLNNKIENNERLEFLWDSILWAIVADLLFHKFGDCDEWLLSYYKISLVNEQILADVARSIDLGKYIFLWQWESNSWWSDKDSVLSDALEALIAYLYINFWYETAKVFVTKYIFKHIDDILKKWVPKSPKSLLQEIVQEKHKMLPEYKITDFEKDGWWNVIKFESQIFIKWKFVAKWFGSSKKKAQEDSASIAIKELQ